MSLSISPFMSEIGIASFNFAPKGWTQCNGQLLPINQNQALFSLLGTTYGGDGRVNFGLPNLQGLAPVHMGGGFTLGQRGGQESHVITQAEMPQHTHFMQASQNAGNSVQVANNVMASALNVYRAPDQFTTLGPTSVTNVGGSQAHPNMQPFLVLNFCIALQGIFPSQN